MRKVMFGVQQNSVKTEPFHEKPNDRQLVELESSTAPIRWRVLKTLLYQNIELGQECIWTLFRQLFAASTEQYIAIILLLE